VDPDASYELATNDYIARGGSGFLVLERNTTQVNTGIPMRQAVIDFLGQQTRCPEASSAGFPNVACIDGQDPTTPWARHDGRITRITSE
jgi:5'-nucleotidase